ncbi:MAG: GIY-YIG nuclease family protein [Bacteroidales bacterium]
MDVEKELLSIFDDPIFSDVKPTEIKATSEDRLVQSFEEVNTFYEQNDRLPSASNGIKEKLLWACLQGILTDEKKLTKLLPYDRFELLRPKHTLDAADLEEVFNNPLLEISSEARSILDVPEHLRKKPQIDASEYIAQRKKCDDFYLFQKGFEQVRQELKTGLRSFVKFSSVQLEQAGNYFLLDGMLLYVAELLEQGRDRKGHFTGRCICIFDNGTMSDLKLDTLRRALYDGGYAVRENNEEVSRFLSRQFKVEDQDQCTGSIYVLKSLSEDPAIRSMENLYKIGFATTSVEERIAHAENEPTYLNAKVKLVASWKAYNLTVSKFESLLHRLFNDVRLQVKVGDRIPMEWFVVPYPIIEKAISCIIKEIPISYDPVNQVIIEYTTAENPEKETIDTTGWKILTLNIKESYFKDIVSGVKKEEYRKLKTSTLNRYTFVDEGKRWLKKYDAIRFFVGYHKDRESALVEIVNAAYDYEKQVVTYSLGKVYDKTLV